MIGKYLPPVGGRTVADGLRDDLSECESWVLRLDADKWPALFKGSGEERTDGLALLRQLDRIADELERLEQRGVELRAESGRFESVLSHLRRRERALVAQVGSEMVTQRPADARWWWHLNEHVATNRRHQLMRTARVWLVGICLLATLYVLYDRFLAPPPNVREAQSHFFQGEQAVSEGDLALAVERFEATTVLDPERAEAYLWVGVLLNVMENGDEATAAFAKARTLFETEAEFMFQRGMTYLALNDLDAANQDALAVIELTPDQPRGYFLLGSVAEQMGDFQLAGDSFQRTAELADSADQAALQVTARIRLANVLQRSVVFPQQ